MRDSQGLSLYLGKRTELFSPRRWLYAVIAKGDSRQSEALTAFCLNALLNCSNYKNACLSLQIQKVQQINFLLSPRNEVALSLWETGGSEISPELFNCCQLERDALLRENAHWPCARQKSDILKFSLWDSITTRHYLLNPHHCSRKSHLTNGPL